MFSKRLIPILILTGAAILVVLFLTNRNGLLSTGPIGVSTSDGPVLYMQFCAQCHGPQGEGLVNLTPPLRGRNLPVFRIKDVIRRGGLKMPPLPFIRGEALEKVARHVAGMK